MTIANLQAVFHDCKHQAVCTCVIKTSYEQVNRLEFYVHDSVGNTPAKIVNSGDEFQLTVANSNGNQITFVKSDHCLFNGEHRKCDCILFDNDKLFFVEIKTVGKGSRSASRQDAVEQLSITIELFRDNGIDISNLDCKAVICFKFISNYPTKASLNSKRAIFQEEYNVSLEEGNLISF